MAYTTGVLNNTATSTGDNGTSPSPRRFRACHDAHAPAVAISPRLATQIASACRGVNQPPGIRIQQSAQSRLRKWSPRWVGDGYDRRRPGLLAGMDGTVGRDVHRSYNKRQHRARASGPTPTLS